MNRTNSYISEKRSINCIRLLVVGYVSAYCQYPIRCTGLVIRAQTGYSSKGGNNSTGLVLLVIQSLPSEVRDVTSAEALTVPGVC